MKALKIIGIIILVLVVLFFILALFLPKGVSMKESIVINKPANLIFQQVNNFHNWDAWSPFLEMDTSMVNSYEGPVKGIGARNSWTAKGGNGSMTIIESVPYRKVVSDLDLGQNAPGKNIFELEETGEGTTVTWRVEIGDLGYPVGRYVAAMMPGMMKSVFQKGLQNLKEVTEAMPDPPALQMVEMPEMSVISVLDSCSWSDIGMKMEEMFGELMKFAEKARVNQAGNPMSAYYVWDEVNQFTVFENRIPVSREVTGKGRIEHKVIPATRAVLGTHFGPYEGTMYLYQAMDEYVSDFGLEMVGGPIEEYVTGPMAEPDTSKWQTNIYFPVK